MSPLADPSSRYHGLVLYHRVALVVCAVAGVLAISKPPETLARVATVAAVATATISPMMRVAWLGVRWWRRRDFAFALAATGLLVLVTVSLVVAVVMGGDG
ncbi:MAG: hypothetical protein KatS3mg008_0233 [Acidimicrobiales bacterium]|nr:MAG: hypothetical protein KatS3mg008_0233 [Acidimicrobiales bacterium]